MAAAAFTWMSTCYDQKVKVKPRLSEIHDNFHDFRYYMIILCIEYQKRFFITEASKKRSEN